MPIELLPCSLPSISVSESERVVAAAEAWGTVADSSESNDHSNANTDAGRMPESVSESERVEAAAEAWGAVDGPATGDGVRGGATGDGVRGGRVPDRDRCPLVVEHVAWSVGAP